MRVPACDSRARDLRHEGRGARAVEVDHGVVGARRLRALDVLVLVARLLRVRFDIAAPVGIADGVPSARGIGCAGCSFFGRLDEGSAAVRGGMPHEMSVRMSVHTSVHSGYGDLVTRRSSENGHNYVGHNYFGHDYRAITI